MEVPGTVYHLMNLVNTQRLSFLNVRYIINVLNTSGFFRDGDIQDKRTEVLLHTKCIYDVLCHFSFKCITFNLYYSWNKTAVSCINTRLTINLRTHKTLAYSSRLFSERKKLNIFLLSASL